MSESNDNKEYTSDLNEEDIWKVIYSYFEDIGNNKNYYLTNHHLDSYNDFVLNKFHKHLKKIIHRLYF